MPKPRILVTSAAGHTGAPVVRQLIAEGFPVRAFVRQRDSRSERLRAVGAEIFTGNLYDYRDLRAAMQDVQRAYHCPPFAPNLLHANMLFALAAEESKLEVVAWMNSWNAMPTHRSPFIRDHWITGQIAAWMPSVDAIHLAPGLFAFAYFLDVQTIVNLGWLLLPLGDAPNAPPANEDIAAVAAEVIARPSQHIGRSYRPTGSRLLTPQNIADICARILGRRVTYRDVSVRMFTKAATALGLTRFEISQIRHFVEEHRGGAFAVHAPTDHIQIITGRAPEEFETTARRYLTQPELVHPRFRVGSKFGAIAMLLRTALTRAPDLDRFDAQVLSPTVSHAELAHESESWRQSRSRFVHPSESPDMHDVAITSEQHEAFSSVN